ncbi:MAG: carboxypeptidase regulatory-like domain-containing protein [Acidobacteriota bacterium]
MKNVKKMLFTSLAALGLSFLVACGGGGEQKPAAEQPAAESAAPTATIDPATAATITGKVTFEGEKPKPRQLRMDAEASCAAQHKEPVYSDDVVVNENNMLQYVFVYVKEGLGDKTFAVSTEPVELDQKGCVYTPHVIGVQTGQTIKIVNSDPTTHNVHPVPANNREWNQSMVPGVAPLERTFAREEVMIPVKCNVHPWMKSYIGVLKHPFFAVTGANGSYEIKGLPPGEYTIEVWHEKLGTTTQKVTVAAKESKTVDFTLKAASPVS